MMDTKQQIQEDMKAAMRAKEQPRLNAIRLILAAIKQKEIDERITLDESDLLILFDKLAKQRRESIQQYQRAERNDLVEKEQFELDIIQSYMPKPLTDAEIDTLIQEAIKATGANAIRDMGKVMAQIKPKIQGRADASQVSAKIKTQLTA